MPTASRMSWRGWSRRPLVFLLTGRFRVLTAGRGERLERLARWGADALRFALTHDDTARRPARGWWILHRGGRRNPGAPGHALRPHDRRRRARGTDVRAGNRALVASVHRAARAAARRDGASGRD